MSYVGLKSIYEALQLVATLLILDQCLELSLSDLFPDSEYKLIPFQQSARLGASFRHS